VEPRHALVTGAGEVVEPVALPALPLVLVPDPEGLSTGDVFRELDREGGHRGHLDAHAVRGLAAADPETVAAALENDLEQAALALRPGLRGTLEALRASGALAARVTGSGPTVYGTYPDRASAARAAEEIEEALVVDLRGPGTESRR
jgi:4-diphosphocytidyl-2-C-methyl-D-erythritol kinase